MNHTPLEDQVHDALHRGIDPLQQAPFDVTDVRRRARRIQRRRTIAACATVAAALAVAVPVGLSMNGPAQRGAVLPATRPTSPPATGPVLIDPRSAPVGDALRVPLIDVDAPSLTIGGQTLDLPQTYDQITPYMDGWIGVVNVEGALSVKVLDADFRVLDEAPTASPLTVSADGARIAWAEDDGAHWVVVDRDSAGGREERRTTLRWGTEVASVRTVGFLPGDGLVVARRRSEDNTETAFVVTADGDTRQLPGFIKPVASSVSSGLVAGQTSYTGDGSCWQASDSTAALVAWQTCDHSLGEFSPDGQHLAGFASYLDANGSPTVSILDATTGESAIDFELTALRRGVVGINTEVVWEDSETLVATLVSGDQQYVVRLGLDGTVERVSVPASSPEQSRCA